MNLATRIKSLFGIGSEGSWRGQFFGMGELGGIYGMDHLTDGWQQNLQVSNLTARHVPAVYACVMAISRSVSQCYPKHIRMDGGFHNEIKTSAAYRVLRNPNDYQTTPDFLLNLVSQTLFDGEAFVLAVRNDRYEVTSLHLLPRGTCSPLVDDETKEIFYSVGSSPLAPGGIDYIVPAKDILHLRFHTPRHPLMGESPITAAALAVGINVALSQNQAAFFNRMNRPSGVLSTDEKLTREQSVQLRAAFEEQSKRWAAGGVPILSSGLKWQQIAISSQDSQLIEAQRMSIQDICRVFGVPASLAGDLSGATFNNSETLIQNFLAMSLGSYLEHIERAFDRLFGLSNNEYIELDLSALLRTDFAGRVEGLTKAIQGGLMVPNEARAREGLSPVNGGDVAYLQRQMTPIDKIGDLLDAETKAKLNPPQPMQAPAAKPDPAPVPDPVADETGKDIDVEVAKALLANYMRKASTK